MIFLVLIFIVVPIAELYVIIQVGGAIGIGPTILVLVLDSLIGAMLLRAQGRAAWVRFNRALSEGRMPHKEVFDGVLVIFGGALLLTPGFITDVLGLILLIPPTRAIVRRIASRTVRRRLATGGAATIWSFGRDATTAPHPPLPGRPRRSGRPASRRSRPGGPLRLGGAPGASPHRAPSGRHRGHRA